MRKGDDMDDQLNHYGVPGMKWGRRKDRSRVNGGGRTRKETNARNSRADAKSRRRSISDSDLDKLVKRLEQEKKLRTLVNEDLHPGRSFVNNTIRQSGSVVAGTVATGVATYVVRGVLTKEWGLKDLAANIPKRKK